MPATPAEKFAEEFLRHYLRNGMGSMSKSDVDALVMHLLDKYIHVNGMSLQQKSNQALSETLFGDQANGSSKFQPRLIP